MRWRRPREHGPGRGGTLGGRLLHVAVGWEPSRDADRMSRSASRRSKSRWSRVRERASSPRFATASSTSRSSPAPRPLHGEQTLWRCGASGSSSPFRKVIRSPAGRRSTGSTSRTRQLLLSRRDPGPELHDLLIAKTGLARRPTEDRASRCEPRESQEPGRRRIRGHAPDRGERRREYCRRRFIARCARARSLPASAIPPTGARTIENPALASFLKVLGERYPLPADRAPDLRAAVLAKARSSP